MKLSEFIAEITDFMQIETPFELEDKLDAYTEWDSMVVLSVLALIDESFEMDASVELTKCITFKDVVSLISDKLEA